MITLFTISSIICLGFISIMLILFKLNSISQSYYELEKLGKSYKLLFSFWAIISVFTLIGVWIEITPDNYRFIAFLSALGLGFVGIAPHFTDTREGKIHFISAAVCLIGSLIWQICVFSYYIWGTVICLYILSILLSLYFKHGKYKERLILFLELIAFISTYTTTLIKLIEYASK